MIAAAFATLALTAFAPADSPIEPIPADLVELGLSTGVGDDLCDAYGSLIPLLTVVLDGDITLAMQVADGYVIDMFEQGMADPGTSAAFTVEARAVFVGFLHGCAS
jgi:hypothetical protein